MTHSIDTLLAATLEIARVMNSELGFEKLIGATIPRLACELLGAERCALFLADIEKGELWSHAATGTEKPIRLKIGEGIAGKVAQSGEAVIVEDPYSHPQFSSQTDRETGFTTRNILCMPMRSTTGELLGVFQVLNKSDGRFSTDDFELLELFGRHAAVAIEGAGTQRELREQVRRNAILYRIEREMNGSEDFEQILSNVIRLCAEAMDADAGSILLLESDGARLYFRYGCGRKAEQLKQLWIPRDEGLAGWVLRERQPALVNDPARDPRHSVRISHQLDYPVENLIAAPLAAGEACFGVVEILNRQGGGFGQDDLDVLTFLASQVSSTVERKRLLEDSRQAQRLASVGSVAARMIHDIKQPMSVVRLVAHDLESGKLDSERQQKLGKHLIGSMGRLGAMTQDVLDYSRGEMTYEFQLTLVSELLVDVLSALERECVARQIQLELAIDRSAIVRVDGPRFGRVLLNLGMNAIEAMPAGGTLTLQVARVDGGASFVVQDDGPGIPEEIRSRLFKPFVTHGKSGGTGLGLAICKSIVDAHGGRIEVESEPGRGAKFTVTL